MGFVRAGFKYSYLILIGVEIIIRVFIVRLLLVMNLTRTALNRVIKYKYHDLIFIPLVIFIHPDR